MTHHSAYDLALHEVEYRAARRRPRPPPPPRHLTRRVRAARTLRRLADDLDGTTGPPRTSPPVIRALRRRTARMMPPHPGGRRTARIMPPHPGGRVVLRG
jgi:hypothetical protein